MNVLADLKRNNRIYGSCPRCAGEFRLKDANLFFAGRELPADALARITEMKAELKQRKLQLIAARERMTATAAKTVEAVNLGKILEKIVPSIAGFAFRPRDCRAVYEPIDYVIFQGLTATGSVQSVTFLDVKTGRARLTDRQRDIQRAVDDGRIAYSVIGDERRSEPCR